MSKKVQKTLTGAMAAMMATGVVATPAMAATNTTDVDALYKAAYQATQKALTEKTQAAVNEARTAIKALPANLDWAIGEFSKQVDTVQHPILVNIVNAIKTAEQTPTQANVNAAKKAIPAELTAQWKNSYSSAVDKIQQGLMNRALEAVKKAETDKTQEAVDAAKELLADLATADSQAIKDWANTLSERVDAIKLYDLTITSAKVTTGGVEVEFDALEEALENATIEVINNKGNKVTVEAKSVLIEGETYASFSFETALKSRPTGVWTINGFEVNLDPINLVSDVIGANNADDLYNVLVDSGLVKNVKESYAKEYYNAESRLEVETLEDVQKLIDDVNASKSEKKDVTYVINLANNGTATQFKNALNSLNLVGVNNDWISEYKKSLKNSDITTLEALQNKITELNNGYVEAEIADSELVDDNGRYDKDLINAAIELVNNYYVVDEDDKAQVEIKNNYVAQLKIKYAIATVNGAKTQTTMKAALKSLETAIADEDVFSYEELVNENVMLYIVKANDDELVLKNDEDVKTLLIEAGQSAAITSALNTVQTTAETIVKAGENVTSAQKTAFLNALNNLETVSKKSDTEFDYSIVSANLVVKYAAVINTTTVDTVTEGIVGINNNLIANLLAEVESAEDKETKLLEVLKDAELGLTNIVDANKSAYYAEYDSIKGLTTKSAIANKVNSINSLVTILKSSDTATVRDNLTKIAVYETGLDKYLNTTSLVKSDIAELLIKAIANKKAGNTTATIIITNEITNLATLKSAVTEVETIRGNIMDKLDVETPSKLVLSDVVSALNLISSDFAKLGTVEKYSVAEAFNEARSTYVSNSTTYLSKLGNFTAVRNLLATVMK